MSKVSKPKAAPAKVPKPPVPVILTQTQLTALTAFVYAAANFKVLEAAPFTGMALKQQANQAAALAQAALIEAFVKGAA